MPEFYVEVDAVAPGMFSSERVVVLTTREGKNIHVVTDVINLLQDSEGNDYLRVIDFSSNTNAEQVRVLLAAEAANGNVWFSIAKSSLKTLEEVSR